MKKIEIIHRCGICNQPIDDDENWTETDCIICEYCSQKEDWDNEEAEYLYTQIMEEE